MTYIEELRRAMEIVARHPRSVFIGQAVRFPGTAMYGTLQGVPLNKRVEFPVAEDMQLGLAIGAALSGDLPICIYPRWNFLLLATNQLVLHLDKLPLYSDGGYKPRVIIRTSVATPNPLDPGEQHLGDFSVAFQSMLETVSVVRLLRDIDVVPAYQAALNRDGSTILVEYASAYT